MQSHTQRSFHQQLRSKRRAVCGSKSVALKPQQLHYAPGAVALYPYGGWFLSNDSRNRLAATQFMASSAPDFTYSYDANSNRTAAVQVQDGVLDWMAELAANVWPLRHVFVFGRLHVQLPQGVL